MVDEFPEFELSSWRIRKFKITDLDLIEKASLDPLIPLITSVPSKFSKEEGTAYIKRQWDRYDKNTGYSFAIAKKDNDQAIGSVYLGLRNIEDGRASLGYWVVEDFRGMGAAKAVLMEIVKWARFDLNIPRLELYVEPWNIASLKTAKSVGFEQEGLMRSWQEVGEKRQDMIMMSLLLE